MNRYQIYLDPQSVDILDTVATRIDMSRSQIIRDVIDRVAAEYKKLFLTTTKAQIKNNPLLQMAGIAKSPMGHISQNVKNDYLID